MQSEEDALIERYCELERREWEALHRYILARQINVSAEEDSHDVVLDAQYKTASQLTNEASHEVTERLARLSVTELLALWKAAKLSGRYSKQHLDFYDEAVHAKTCAPLDCFNRIWSKKKIEKLAHVDFEAIHQNIKQLLAFAQAPDSSCILMNPKKTTNVFARYLPLLESMRAQQVEHENARALALAMAHLPRSEARLRQLHDDTMRRILALTEHEKLYGYSFSYDDDDDDET